MFCFRKKPTEIQATLWPGGAGNASHVIDWIISGDVRALLVTG